MGLFDIFGFKHKVREDKSEQRVFELDKDILTDGAVLENGVVSGGVGVLGWNMVGTPTEDTELITQYRQIASHSEIDEALNEIRNETFIYDIPGERAFELAFTEEKGAPSKSIQKRIIEEFRNLYQITDFHNKGQQYFDDWYIDSRLILHKVIDENNPRAGIKRVVRIDPFKIRRIRIVPRPDKDGLINATKIREVYVFSNTFNPKWSMSGYTDITFGSSISGLQISPDAVSWIDSGLFDRDLGRYVGYLKKAIVPFNNLRMMEEAMLIFRVVRAPQRRAIYVDVAGMQKNKAEQYIKDMMSRFKNKMVYDSKSGSLMDRRNIMSMLEDYWLPRRDGGRATEIQTLEGQNATDILEEVEYYRNKLWRALNVPISRFSDNPAGFNFGKSTEIQRDEYRFKKFIDKLRQHFMMMFDDLLKTQLILKKVIQPHEWEDIRRFIFWNFAEDNAFVEYKESELIANRIAMLGQVEPHVGKYFSEEWVRRKILRFSDQEIAQEDERIETERPEPDEFDGPRVQRNRPQPKVTATPFGNNADTEDPDDQPDAGVEETNQLWRPE